MNGINKLSDGSGATNPNSYMGNATVNQLGRGYQAGRFSQNNSGSGDGSSGTASVQPLRTYYFDGIFPTQVGSIELSYDNTDAIAEYPVTFQVQYWVAGTNSTNGSTSDQTGDIIV